MHAHKCEYGAGDALVHLPGKQVRLRPVVRAGALHTRRSRNRQPSLERKLDKLLKNQADMQKDLVEVQKDLVEVQKDLVEVKKDLVEVKKDLVEVQKSIVQLTTDTAVNKALVAVNLTPAALLVLGVLYFVYNNFQASGGN